MDSVDHFPSAGDYFIDLRENFVFKYYLGDDNRLLYDIWFPRVNVWVKGNVSKNRISDARLATREEAVEHMILNSQ